MDKAYPVDTGSVLWKTLNIKDMLLWLSSILRMFRACRRCADSNQRSCDKKADRYKYRQLVHVSLFFFQNARRAEQENEQLKANIERNRISIMHLQTALHSHFCVNRPPRLSSPNLWLGSLEQALTDFKGAFMPQMNHVSRYSSHMSGVQGLHLTNKSFSLQYYIITLFPCFILLFHRHFMKSDSCTQPYEECIVISMYLCLSIVLLYPAIRFFLVSMDLLLLRQLLTGQREFSFVRSIISQTKCKFGYSEM